jgi:hypothetical protein
MKTKIVLLFDKETGFLQLIDWFQLVMYTIENKSICHFTTWWDQKAIAAQLPQLLYHLFHLKYYCLIQFFKWLSKGFL